MVFQRLGSLIRSATWVCAAALGCTHLGTPTGPTGLPPGHLATLAPPGLDEPYCAWFGDVAGDELIFGISAFWGAMGGAHGDPTADLQIEGPQWIGRFDLARNEMGDPIDVSRGSHPGGVWDLLSVPGGRVFFSTYFDAAGFVELESGHVQRLPELGLGLNEWAQGPDQTVLVTRYGFAEDSEGAVVVLDRDGSLLTEHLLDGPEGIQVAAKSLAYDPLHREIWVNTDLLPETDGAIGHDIRVLRWDGTQRARWSDPELQFMTFSDDGVGVFAELLGTELWLRWRAADPELAWAESPRFLLDPNFPVGLDFVQDIRLDAPGTAVVTRWSGKIHVVEAEGGHRQIQLPRPGGQLYYTGVLRDGQICATRCGAIEVACQTLPPIPPAPNGGPT